MEQKIASSLWASLSSNWFELLIIICYEFLLCVASLTFSLFLSCLVGKAHNKKKTYTWCHYCSKSAIEVMACAMKQSSKDSGLSLVATEKSKSHPLGIFHLQTKRSLKLDKLDLGKRKKVTPIKLD